MYLQSNGKTRQNQKTLVVRNAILEHSLERERSIDGESYF